MLHRDLQRLLLHYTEAKTHYAFCLLSSSLKKIFLTPYFEQQSRHRLLRRVIKSEVCFWTDRVTTIIVIQYPNGVWHGLFEEWYQGKCEQRGYYRDGKPDGTFFTYDTHGYYKSLIQYRKSLRHGHMVMYHPSNHRMSHCMFHVNDQRHGLEESFDEYGDVTYSRLWQYNKSCY